MSAVLILYGSRARGETRPGSDVDLILAEEGMSLRPSITRHGISVHLYSQDWLEAEALAGSLFCYHVAHEGISLRDEDGFLERLRQQFRKKASYRAEIETAALILRMLLEKDWGDNLAARRRYFWAIRTILISTAADQNSFLFASTALETFAEIRGLAAHIDAREAATFETCAAFGAQVSRIIEATPDLRGLPLRDHLIALGGIGRDSVRLIEEREAVEASGLAIYL